MRTPSASHHIQCDPERSNRTQALKASGLPLRSCTKIIKPIFSLHRADLKVRVAQQLMPVPPLPSVPASQNNCHDQDCDVPQWGRKPLWRPDRWDAVWSPNPMGKDLPQIEPNEPNISPTLRERSLLTSCVTIGRLFNPSVLWFSYCKVELRIHLHYRTVVRIKWVLGTKLPGIQLCITIIFPIEACQ